MTWTWKRVASTRAPGGPLKGALDPSVLGSKPFLIGLGRLVAESALAEDQLNRWIYTLVGHGQRTAQIVCADLDFRRKMNLVLALARESGMDARLLGKLKRRINAIQLLYNERNDYIHGMWASGSKRNQRSVVRESAKGVWKWSAPEIEAIAIVRLATSFNKAAAALSDLRTDYLFHR